MNIKASVGNAPKTVGLSDQVYSMTLTAQTLGEKQWLAALLKAVPAASDEAAFCADVPVIKIQTIRKKGER